MPIASYVPLMMFAVLFGLSMDYEVFLVSHVQQHHLAGERGAAGGARRACASSARITTAAALIMASVFASFILNGDPTIKQFGPHAWTRSDGVRRQVGGSLIGQSASCDTPSAGGPSPGLPPDRSRRGSPRPCTAVLRTRAPPAASSVALARARYRLPAHLRGSRRERRTAT